MEFFPVGVIPDQSGVLLHETGYLARNNWWNFPNTLSPFWRLYYNDRRGHKVVFPCAEYDLGPAHIVLIPEQQLFHSVGNTPVPHLWMTFKVGRPLDAQQGIPILLKPSGTERQLFREVAAHFSGIGTGNRERVLHVSLAILHLVLSRPEILWQTEPLLPGVARARRTIESRLTTRLNLQKLAIEVGMGLRNLAAGFKRETGTTLHQFHIQARIREAAHLLANTDETLESIAERTGFPNRHYLTRVFKKVTGDTPAAFRHKTSRSG
jgi:AraC family transcriptional regulator, arabinose operon regulatory protein